MEKFVFVVDEAIKNRLLQEGYKLISTMPTVDGTMYCFENKPELSMVLADHKVVFTNRLPFNGLLHP